MICSIPIADIQSNSKNAIFHFPGYLTMPEPLAVHLDNLSSMIVFLRCYIKVHNHRHVVFDGRPHRHGEYGLPHPHIYAPTHTHTLRTRPNTRAHREQKQTLRHCQTRATCCLHICLSLTWSQITLYSPAPYMVPCNSSKSSI